MGKKTNGSTQPDARALAPALRIPLAWAAGWAAICAPICAPAARADGFRAGALVGLGGAAIKKEVAVNGAKTDVVRNEGPLLVALGVDYIMSDRWALGAEHLRGIHMSPFSSGVSFTGVVGRWYPFSPVPSAPAVHDQTLLVQKNLSPYLGLGAGAAFADVSRKEEASEVEHVSDSGFYFYPRVGVDYQLRGGLGWRAEIGGASASGIAASKTAISSFGIFFGLFIVL